jgi:hypothetical protein
MTKEAGLVGGVPDAQIRVAVLCALGCEPSVHALRRR